LAVDSDGQCGAYLAHPSVGDSSESLNEHRERDALHGIKVHRRSLWNRVIAGLENDLARE